MDSYSGRFPLDFISFCLDMSSEQEPPITDLAEATQDLSNPQHLNNSQPTEEEGVALQLGTRPLSNLSSSSGNTGESLSAFADQTLRTLANSDPTLDIRFLTVPNEDSHHKELEPSISKVSESNVPVTIQPRIQKIDVEQQSTTRLFDSSIFDLPEERQRKNYFETDASELEDLYDRAGADGLTDRPTSSIVGSDLITAANDPEESTSQGPNATRSKGALIAHGRLMLRKYFAQNSPIELPRGHTTVAFSEPQIHAVLKTLSDETVKSSLHSMRSLVLQAVHEGMGQTAGQLRKALIRGSIPDISTTVSSEGESDGEGYTTDGNSNGAYTTDEELGGRVTSQEAGSESGTPAIGKCVASNTADRVTSLDQAVVPSPGYSEGDYEPLCSMGAQSARQSSKRSRPRKRQRSMSRPGKVMKPAYFKGIQWTKVFVTGPLDPVLNKYKFYCQICKTNVSIFAKGAREIVRHYRTEDHLRKDHRWRYEHLGKLDKVSGTIAHAVRGKDGHVLTTFELQKEKPLFESAPLVDISLLRRVHGKCGGIDQPRRRPFRDPNQLDRPVCPLLW